MATTKELCLDYLRRNGPSMGGDVMKAVGKPATHAHSYLKTYKEVVRTYNDGGKMLWALAPEFKPFVRPIPAEEAAAPVVAPMVPASTLDGAIEGLVSALVARITTDVQTRVEELVAESIEPRLVGMIERMTAKVGGKPTAIPVSKPKLPRVLIVGLLPEQQHMIGKEFGDTLDTRFVGTNENAKVLKSNAAQADRVFAMQDFISHSTVEAIVSASGVTPVVVQGGMTHLRDALTSYYVNGTH